MPTFDTLSQLWDRVRTSLWFVPGLMALSSLVLAVLTPAIDRVVADEWLRKLPLVYSGQPAGARAVLSTIATAMIATAGVVFSMTIVSLQLASSQFGPRLLRTFLRDRGNQFVLGTFIGVFLYCILILPTIDDTSESKFVPHIAVSFALLFAIVGLGMLVYFIDHVAQSIHADAVIQSVADELDGVIEHLFPDPIGDHEPPDADEDLPTETTMRPQTLASSKSGYLRFVNGDAVLSVAVEHDLVVQLDVQPGQYVFEGDVIASVWPAESITHERAQCLRDAFVLGAHRTPIQDVSFAFEQLTEMAVRALSAGISDPTTAVHCIDRVGSGLSRFVGRQIPSRLRRDDKGLIRLVVEPIRLEQILDDTIEPIRRNAGVQLPVWLRLFGILEKTHDRAKRARDQSILRHRTLELAGHAKTVFEQKSDLARIGPATAWAVRG